MTTVFSTESTVSPSRPSPGLGACPRASRRTSPPPSHPLPPRSPHRSDTNLIVELVPNYDSFIVALRCIRLWAKRRGLYSNKMGYLGGINCSILTALVCQLFPNGSPSAILRWFFKIFSQWEWTEPVMLCEVVDLGYDFEVWSNRGRQNVMPMITPAYPAFNSSLSVNTHSLEVMRAELLRGVQIIKDVEAAGGVGGWNKLFESHDFFVRYDRYMMMNILGCDKEEKENWAGYVVSRARKLVERVGRLPMTAVHLLPKELDRIAEEGSELPGHEGAASTIFIGIELDRERIQGDQVTFSYILTNFVADDLKTFTDRTPTMDVAFDLVEWKQLPKFVFKATYGTKRAAYGARCERRAAAKAVADKAAAEAEAAAAKLEQTNADAAGVESTAALAADADATSGAAVYAAAAAAAGTVVGAAVVTAAPGAAAAGSLLGKRAAGTGLDDLRQLLAAEAAALAAAGGEDFQGLPNLDTAGDGWRRVDTVAGTVQMTYAGGSEIAPFNEDEDDPGK